MSKMVPCPCHTCSACTLTELPFHDTRNLNETLDSETQIILPSRDFHIDKLQANQNNTSFAHLNVQTLMCRPPFDEPDDKITVLNKLVHQCISEYVPIKRMKFTRPPAPWMKDPEISKAKNVLDNLQTKSRDLNHFDLTFRQNYQSAGYCYKKQLDRKKLLSWGRC